MSDYFIVSCMENNRSVVLALGAAAELTLRNVSVALEVAMQSWCR
jgi:hypothetical protein